MLNNKYYIDLLNKYKVSLEDTQKVSALTVSIILSQYGSKILHFNLPGRNDILNRIFNGVYEILAQQIFTNHADITDYSIGDKLKRNSEKGKNLYAVKRIVGSDYFLTKENDNTNLDVKTTFDKLKKNYTQIKQNTRNSTLSKYNNYFNEHNKYGFLPTHFSKKVVFIVGKTLLDKLENKDCIPSIYLPNTKEDNQTSIKSIPALEDCLAYVTPKYSVCHMENSLLSSSRSFNGNPVKLGSCGSLFFIFLYSNAVFFCNCKKKSIIY
ncbi:hypothetical protein Barb4_02838 [Bacteroidales bacterium Barb4]|nr:hypothetical protein Barb4_02838 [Bacteroidales bacterium Barb4]